MSQEKIKSMVDNIVNGNNLESESDFKSVMSDKVGETLEKERQTIARHFEEKFPGIQAVVGGDTGIDSYPVGSDKSQILRDFDIDNDFIYFFGDKMDFGGNDWPLKMKFVTDKWAGKIVAVEGWKDTFSHLQEIERNNFK